jgi:hypothetical protein
MARVLSSIVSISLQVIRTPSAPATVRTSPSVAVPAPGPVGGHHPVGRNPASTTVRQLKGTFQSSFLQRKVRVFRRRRI